MDATCKFGLEYLPLGKAIDPVVQTHVSNCPDCQDQVTLL